MTTSNTFNAAIVAAILAGVVGFVMAQAQSVTPQATAAPKVAHVEATARVAQANGLPLPAPKAGRS